MVSGKVDDYRRVVVEEETKTSPCVWIARAGLEFGHHPRWAVLLRGKLTAISLAFSCPLYPFNQIPLIVPLKLHS
jgi:hypothetical protein